MASSPVLRPLGEAVASGSAATLPVCHRERLRLAGLCASTLERFQDEGAWSELDVRVGEHLLGLAARLHAWVAGLAACGAAPMHAATLASLERRLAAVLGRSGASSDAAGAGAGRAPATSTAAFTGSFCEVAEAGRDEPDEECVPTKRRARRRTAAASGGAASALRRGIDELGRRALRIAGFVAVGALIAVVSIAYNGLTKMNEPPKTQSLPPRMLEQNAFLDDAKLFVPATHTVLSDRALDVVVDKQWLLEPEAKRQEAARALHAFLQNRNVPRLLVRWGDGAVIAAYEKGEESWFGAGGMTERPRAR